MGWHVEILFILLMRYTAGSSGDQIYQDNLGDEGTIFPIEDEKLENLGRILAHLLIQPWPKGVSPLLYVEYGSSEYTPEKDSTENDISEESNIPFKRSRYYRKYPWKRQNSRYDAENRYLCQPSKEDVFRLLVALHEARQGNRGQIINFCNRKRPASAIFTNIRFLG